MSDSDPFYPSSTPHPPATISPHIAGETYDQYVARAVAATLDYMSEPEWANALQTLT